MGNATSNSEEKELLKPEDELDRRDSNRYKKDSGRIIHLEKTIHSHRTANYHFIAVCNGIIFVTNSCDGGILRYCIKSGRQLSGLTSKITSKELRGIVALSNRKTTTRTIIVVGDQGRKRLVVLDVQPSGDVEYETSFAKIGECCGLADNGSDEVYAADWAQHTVKIFKENSGCEGKINFQLIRTISHKKMKNPYCITRYGSSIIVGQPMTASLLVFSEKGSFLKEFLYRELMGNESPRGMATDRDGNILIANGLGNNVLIIDVNGNLSQILKDSDILNTKCIRDIKIYKESMIILACLNENSFDEEVLIIL